MGYLPEPTPEMGEYHVEVRGESFCLRAADLFGHLFDEEPLPRHVIYVYPDRHSVRPCKDTLDCRCGSIELLIEDIPKLRAALDQVERVREGRNG